MFNSDNWKYVFRYMYMDTQPFFPVNYFEGKQLLRLPTWSPRRHSLTNWSYL